MPDSPYWQKNSIFSHQVFDFWCSPTSAFGSTAGFKFRKHNAKSHHVHFWLSGYLPSIWTKFNLHSDPWLQINERVVRKVKPFAKKIQKPSTEWVSTTVYFKMKQETRKCSLGTWEVVYKKLEIKCRLSNSSYLCLHQGR